MKRRARRRARSGSAGTIFEYDVVDEYGRESGLRRIWGLLRGNRTIAVGQSILSLLEGAVEAAVLTLFARIALSAVNGSSNNVAVPLIGGQGTTASILVLSGLIVIRLLLGTLSAIAVGQLQFRLVTRIRSEVVDAYSRTSWRAQGGLDEGGLQQLVVNLPNKASGSIAGLLKSLGQILVMVAMLSVALFTNLTITLSLMAAIVLTSLAFLPLRRWVKSQSVRVLKVQRSLSSAATEMSTMKFEVQAFGIGTRMASTIRALILRDGRLKRRLNIGKSMVVPLYTTMTYSAVTIGLVVVQSTTADGLDTIGPILLIVLRSLGYGQGVQQVVIAMAGLTPVLESLREETNRLNSNRIEWGDTNLSVIERIDIAKVSFSYAETDRVALRNVSITFGRGERIGIVGPSGSGKSTFVRLLLGLIQQESGSVLINGSPIHSYTRATWSKQIGVVPQSPQVLRGTLEDNLRMYRDDISIEDLWWALGVADLADEVRAMPEGIKTRIGAGARSLSGGQQQRLAIARALATRPDLIVMDEPSSSIDAMSEAAISDALGRFSNHVTVLVVSHRMRILQECGRLIVFEDGAISADGPAGEVITSNPYLISTLSS